MCSASFEEVPTRSHSQHLSFGGHEASIPRRRYTAASPVGARRRSSSTRLADMAETVRLWAAVMVCLAVTDCARKPAAPVYAVEFTLVPEAAPGGPDRMAPIAGRVRGAHPG